MDYALDLGLRYPNGATIQCMTGLIHFVDMKSLRPGELYVHQRKISISFRAHRVALEKQIGMTKDLIKFLDPETVEQGVPCQVPHAPAHVAAPCCPCFKLTWLYGGDSHQPSTAYCIPGKNCRISTTTIGNS